MSNDITFKNNFHSLQEEFKKDTGLGVKDNMSIYIQYYNARMNDQTYQLNFHAYNRFLNELHQLPNKLRLEIADLLRTHEVIGKLLKNKP